MTVHGVAKGQRYRHRAMRGTWTVRSAGEKFVTLKSEVPHLKPQRIPTAGFLAAGWERV